MAALREAAEIPNSPFAEDTRSALRKLSFDLDPVSVDPSVFRVVETSSMDLRSTMQTLSDSLLRRKRVMFSYQSPARGQPTSRDVASYGLMFEFGAWYLIGHDELREEIRGCRGDRMDNLRTNAKRPGTSDRS